MAQSATTHRHREQITVAREIASDAETDAETFTDDGQRFEELDVWNMINVTMAHQVRGGNPITETFPSESSIEIAYGGREPDYVTEWVAENLWHEHAIDLPTDEFDIEAVDIESDDVHIL